MFIIWANISLSVARSRLSFTRNDTENVVHANETHPTVNQNKFI